jgi:TolB-like protein/DNA-binding winged helix-turn-helix (wHTH) protein
MTPDGSPMIAPERGRRVDLALEPDFRLGPLQVSPAAREAVSGDRRELLEPRIMQVLVRLARTPGVVVSRDELIECCWEGRIVGEDAINRVIAKLRRLSEQDEGAAFTIETIPRVGYRLWPAAAGEAPAEEAGFSEASPPPVAPAATTTLPAAAAPSRRLRRPAVIALAAVALGLAGSAAVYAGGEVLRPGPQATLAVLPFRDLSPGGTQAHFAEGVAEDIQTALAGEESVTVIGRTSARAYRDAPDLEALRKAMKVSHVLEGSVQARGEQLRMNVRLIRTSDGAQVWAESYSRPAADVFAAQDEISGGVARALRRRFGFGAQAPEPVERTSVAAYDLVLAARARLREARPDDIAAALTLARRATAADPDYGPAWAALAQAALEDADGVDRSGRTPLAQARATALDAARKAVALAPDRAEGYAALARASDGEAALTAARRAVALDGSAAENRIILAERLEAAGDHLGALQQLQTAARVDPLNDSAHLRLAYLLAQLGRFGEAERVVAEYDALHREPVESAMIRAYLAFQRGDWSEVVRQGEKAHSYPDAYYRADLMGRAYRLLGLKQRASGLARMTAHPFEAAVWAGDDEAAWRAYQAMGPAVWDDPVRAWMAGDLLGRTGRLAELRTVFDRRYGSAKAYCERQEVGTAFVFAAALQAAGRGSEATTLLDCAERPLLAARKSGLERGRTAFTLAQAEALRGRRDAALDWLQRAYAEGYRGELYADLRDRIAFRRLDGDPRFEGLRRRFLEHAATERRELAAADRL